MHSISPAITASAGALGALTASVTTDTTGTGTGGVITWNYSVADFGGRVSGAQTRPRSRPSPSRSTTATAARVDRTISVTITGTNDAPVVAATDVTGAVTELVTRRPAI